MHEARTLNLVIKTQAWGLRLKVGSAYDSSYSCKLSHFKESLCQFNTW